MWNPLRSARAELDGWRTLLAAAPTPPADLPFRRIRAPIRRAIWVLTREHASPVRLGVAVFLGCVIGATPLYGAHLALCLVLGFPLRLNKLAMWLAANISLPVFAPFLAFTSYQVAYWWVRGEAGPLSLAAFRSRPVEEVLSEIFVYWLIGSIPVGAAIGGVLGSVTAAIVLERRRNEQPGRKQLDDAIRAIHRALLQRLGHLRSTPAWVFYFKTNADPVYLELLHTLPPGASILDVGGGEGYLPLLHAVTHRTVVRRRVLDWDVRRVKVGRLIAELLDLHVEFDEDDARTGELPTSDVVLCVDVLHYLPASEQDDLLARLAAAVNPGGSLYVRDIDGRRGWRTRATVWQERWSLAVGRTKGAAIVVRPVGEWADLLRGLGFDVTVRDAFEGTPLSNVLLVARRRPDGA